MMKRIFSRRSLLLSALYLTLGAAPAALLTGCKDDDVEKAEQTTAEQKVKDDEAIRKYLTDNNITDFQRTDDGLYLVNLTQGAGDILKIGNTAQIKYIGKLLDGTKFDSSVDNGTLCGCIGVRIDGKAAVSIDGRGVVQGWNKAIPNLKVGDHKLLLIPSYLGYGAQASQAIPANSPLLFDLTVIRQY